MKNEYEVTYVSGGGTEYKDGVWKLKSHTEKYRTFERKSKGFYISAHLPQEVGGTIKIPNNMSEGLFSIYPRGCGLPHIFEPVKK